MDGRVGTNEGQAWQRHQNTGEPLECQAENDAFLSLKEEELMIDDGEKPMERQADDGQRNLSSAHRFEVIQNITEFVESGNDRMIFDDDEIEQPIAHAADRRHAEIHGENVVVSLKSRIDGDRNDVQSTEKDRHQERNEMKGIKNVDKIDHVQMFLSKEMIRTFSYSNR